MKKLFVTIALLLIANVSFAQQNAAFKADVLRYLEVSGQSAAIKSLSKQIATQIPEAKQAAFLVEFDASIKDFLSKTADVYMTEFTPEDMKQILKFYDSPVGKKLTSKSELLLEKGKTVGEEWGKSLQPMMMKYSQ